MKKSEFQLLKARVDRIEEQLDLDPLMTPKECAAKIGGGVTSKAVRDWLRANYPRPKEEANKPWILTLTMFYKARDHFAVS
jgi:hypothetical protein